MPKKPKAPKDGAPGDAAVTPATVAMPGMDFDFASVFQATKLEGFFKGVLQKVSVQDQVILELKERMTGLPTQENLETARTGLYNHVTQNCSTKANRDDLNPLRDMVEEQSIKFQALEAQIKNFEKQMEQVNKVVHRNQSEINNVRTELELHKGDSVGAAKYDLLQFAQMQSCKEWRATGEAMQELTERCNDMQRQMLGKAVAAKLMALASKIAEDSQINKEHAQRLEEFAEDLEQAKAASARALLVGEREALAVFHTVEFEKKIADDVAGLAAKVDEMLAGADDDGDGIPDWLEDKLDELKQNIQKEAEEKTQKEKEEAEAAAAAANKEQEEAAAANAAANKEEAEAAAAAAAAAKEAKDVAEAEEALTAAKKTGNAEAIKAAEDKLQLEMAEAEEARLVAEREKAEAEEARRTAEREAEEARVAKELADKERAEHEAAMAAEAAGLGGGGGANKDDIDRIDRTMERLAGKVLSCSQKVSEMLKEGGGGGSSAGVSRLQEELMLNTQKTENELDRMSEYLDKMSEQLASCWEQKANASELYTLRADVDALLGQREGDVHQIKSVLTQMETTLRNPTLPSTAVGVHTAAGGVAGMRQMRAERGPGN